MYNQKNIKKVCSFYVSDLHLITMLLPYLDNKIKEEENFITISQRDLTEELKLVLSKVTLNENSKKQLMNINWNSDNMSRYEVLENELNRICKDTEKLSIVINGTVEYIQKVNDKLDKILKSNSLQSNIKIIDCYDITKLDDDIKDILKTHEVILNTSGEKEISEVFEGYECKGA